MAEKNQLHKFASYNALFTLSGINESDMKNMSYLTKPTRNIIAKSGGIGDAPKHKNSPVRDNVTITPIDSDPTVDIAIGILDQKRDIFIDDVNILSTASPNFERNLGTFTKIEFKMTEPYQCSLLDKLKGAAARERYIDYHDAPFLLTIEFRGFDEKGGVMPLGPAENLTRKIPVMIVKVEFDINEGGTTYQVQAVPYIDIAYDDRYKHVRKQVSVTIGTGETYETWCNDVQKHLNANGLSTLGNSQMDVEIKQGLRQLPDYYEFLVHPDLKGKLTFKTVQERLPKVGDTGQPAKYALDSAGIYPGGLKFKTTHVEPDEAVYDKEDLTNVNFSRDLTNDSIDNGFAAFTHTFNPGDALPKVIEDVVRVSDPFSLSLDTWYKGFAAASGAFNEKTNIDKLSPEQIIKKVYEASEKGANQNTKDYVLKNSYIDWFRVVPSVQTMQHTFDSITNMHPKIITYTVIPYQVHINKFVIPGVTIPAPPNPEQSVRKSYNYIYTGDNVDVLNFHINYKAAFFLRNHMPDQKTQQESGVTDKINNWLKGLFDLNKSPKSGDAATGQNNAYNTLLDTRQYPSLVKSKNTVGGLEENPRGVAFFDYLTNPEADMLRVELEILGDAAYLSDKTFIPTSAYYQNEKSSNQDYEDGQFMYNNYLPVININFRFPDDPIEKQGVYFDSRPTSKLFFNGLYHLIKVDNKFESGRFTQILTLARLLNQDGKQTKIVNNAVEQDKRLFVNVPKFNYEEKADNIGETYDLKGNKKSKERIIEETENIVRNIKGL
jgi:hypothetical protein